VASVLHHLLALGFRFLSLLRGQQRLGLPLGFDRRHVEGDGEVSALLDLCLDAGQVGLVVLNKGHQFAGRNRNLGAHANPGAIKIQLERLELGHLLIGESDRLPVSQKIAKVVAGMSVVARHVMAGSFPMLPMPPTGIMVTIGPQEWGVHSETDESCYE
jgi:hypothetical protein